MISKKKNCKRYTRSKGLSCGTKFFVRVYFCGLAFFVFVSRDLISAIRTDWSFLLEINFCNFQKVLHKQIIDNTFVFIEFVQWK